MSQQTKHAISIFNRGFRRIYNENKYQAYTLRGESKRPPFYYSLSDIKLGRFAWISGFMAWSIIWYFDSAEWLHETNLEGALDSKERELNNQLIHREHEEHRLHQFLEVFKATD